MADIRINALATTATTPASDDYLALDGTAQGTRKILATNIANNVTDVILGSSGPSVRSSLSARAPRQGLVFDGTAGATVSVPALGTADYTFAIWINPTSLSTQERRLLGSDSAGAFEVQIDRGVAGSISVIKSNVSVATTTGALLTAGKQQLVTITRTGTSGVISINGVQAATFTDSQNYTIASDKIGVISTLQFYYKGGLIGPLVYNRALSASEVVSLYEAGAPAGADYNSASNTAIYSTDFSTSTGWTAETGWSITGGVAVLSGSNAGALYRSAVSSLKQGSRYRITFTVASYVSGGVRPWIQIGSSRVLGTARTANGTYTEEIIAPSATGSSYVGIEASTSAACSLNVDDYSYFNSGLLLAPDAAQAGGGLVWYDTSGNAANITLPASGVSWNVPFGNNIAASGTNQNITLTPSGTGSVVANTASGASIFLQRAGTLIGSVVVAGVNEFALSAAAGKVTNLYANGYGAVGLSILANANVLVGKTIDSSNGRVQLADHTTSAGGIGFGTDTSLFRTAAGEVGLDALSGTATVFGLRVAGTRKSYLYWENGTSTLTLAAEAASSSLKFLSANTLALTLDSSQNATFAGTIVAVGNSTFKRSDNTGSIRIIPTSGVSAGSDIESFNASTSAYGRLNTRGTHLQVYTGPSANTLALTVDDSQNATFAGSIAIGNTVQTAASVASTHKVTISIGGSTYYLLATNV